MKVLVLTPSYPGADDPHAGIFIHRQVLNLVRCGVDCRVLVFRPAPPPFPLWLGRPAWWRYFVSQWRWRDVDGVHVDSLFYQRRWTDNEDVVPAIADALRLWMAGNPEWRDAAAIYAQFLWPSAAAAQSLRGQFDIPVVGILRGGEVQEWYERKSTCRDHVHATLRSLDEVLANCAALKAEADRLEPGVGDRIEVVYNGCDVEFFRPAVDRAAVRATLGVGADDRIVVSCGTIETRKGIQELAEAWRVFGPRHPRWRLIVVGRTVDSQLAADLQAAGGSRVRLTGALSPARVVQVLQGADLYVQASRQEGLANATMEAMAVGLTVISTGGWGQSELIRDGENGLLVPVGDSAALAGIMSDIAADDHRRTVLGAAARRTIETHFDAKVHAQQLARILTRVAATRRGRAVASTAHAH